MQTLKTLVGYCKRHLNISHISGRRFSAISNYEKIKQIYQIRAAVVCITTTQVTFMRCMTYERFEGWGFPLSRLGKHSFFEFYMIQYPLIKCTEIAYCKIFSYSSKVRMLKSRMLAHAHLAPMRFSPSSIISRPLLKDLKDKNMHI